MKYICVFPAAFCLLCSASLYAQRLSCDRDDYFENLTEEIAAGTDIQVDYTVLFEDLYNYYEDPLNLNMAGYDQLKKLHFLNDFQIQCLLDYIKENGELLTIHELHYIYGFSQKEINFLVPFVTVNPVSSREPVMLTNALKKGRHEIFLRTQRILEKQKGFKTVSDSILEQNPDINRYLGSPQKLYTRYKFHSGDRIYAGFTAEKDAGEELFNGNNKYGFDFLSAHLQLNDISIFKTIHAGDYHLQFGQGLTLWSGLTFGKSSYVLNIKKRAEGIKRYTSSEENMFFRGAAGTVSIGDFNITPFYSHKKRDANIIDTISPGFYEFSSFQNTGYHRTPSENYDEKAITETAYGANISYKKENFQLGTTFINSRFGGELHEKERVYNRFDFNGSEITNIGIDYQANIQKINIFGETTYGNKGWGMIHGTMIYVNNLVAFSAFYRMYQKNFYAHNGNALSENSNNANENGFYAGTEIRPLKYWKISAYADIYKFPWLKYNANAPSVGSDYLVQADYTPDKNFEMNFRLKYENEYENDIPEDTSITKLDRMNNLKIRFNISYMVSNNITLRNRLELSRTEKQDELPDKGYLLYQDIIYKFHRFPADLYFRYAMFDTHSYNSRIYVYENDLLYSYSIPSFFYKGTRTYLMIKYTALEGIDIWLKYALTSYSNRESIGSGLSEIDGNIKSEIRFQLRVKF